MPRIEPLGVDSWYVFWLLKESEKKFVCSLQWKIYFPFVLLTRCTMTWLLSTIKTSRKKAVKPNFMNAVMTKHDKNCSNTETNTDHINVPQAYSTLVQFQTNPHLQWLVHPAPSQKSTCREPFVQMPVMQWQPKCPRQQMLVCHFDCLCYQNATDVGGLMNEMSGTSDRYYWLIWLWSLLPDLISFTASK